MMMDDGDDDGVGGGDGEVDGDGDDDGVGGEDGNLIKAKQFLISRVIEPSLIRESAVQECQAFRWLTWDSQQAAFVGFSVGFNKIEESFLVTLKILDI